MLNSTEPPFELTGFDTSDAFVVEHEDAVVYGDADGESVLHEGPVRVLANGWIQVPTGRLLSPSAVHHVDPVPDDE